jgi:acetyltransferase-like isoleucine patch superfamily enzyme
VDYGCRIGDRVKIHNNVYLAQFTTVEDDVFIGPGVTTTNDRHPVCTKCMKGPTIRRRARIGGGAALLPGVEIGESALVGAGAVVVRDVPPFAVVAGNPARVIGDVRKLRCRCGEKDLAYPEDR